MDLEETTRTGAACGGDARSGRERREASTASGGTRTHDTLYSRQSALPTDVQYTIIYLGTTLKRHGLL